MRSNKIKVFYNPKQVRQADSSRNFSKSPLKPKLLLEHLTDHGMAEHLDITDKFRPFNAYDFQIAHSIRYVASFFKGGYLAETNSLEWSPQFADSVRYTNASLFEAIQNCILHPEEVSFSPTSGFHHATPNAGRGYCTFSGQVIASVKAWRKYGAVGCYVDLDGHFGNSIGDSRQFQPDLNSAVPEGFNYNSYAEGDQYYFELVQFLTKKLTPAILDGKIDYVVWCHGADSHEDDMLGHQASTEIWVKCATFFWAWVKRMDDILGRPLPVACALFGGYRQDDYNSVLSLHASDLRECMNQLLDLGVEYTTDVKPRIRPMPRPYQYVTDNSGSTRSYIPSTDKGARIHDRAVADRVMMEQQRRERERERDRQNEEEFERYYALRQRLNGRTE